MNPLIIEIKLRSNTESNLQTNESTNIEIFLRAQINLFTNSNSNSNSKVFLSYNANKLVIGDIHILSELSKEVIGAKNDELVLTLRKHLNNTSFIDMLSGMGNSEINLLKSIFLIYYWIELPLLNQKKEILEELLFNNFFVDMKNEAGLLDSVYFISKKHITDTNIPYIQNLIDKNLLVSFEIQVNQSMLISSYFVPLIKDSVTINNINNLLSNKGALTHRLWDDILQERNYKIDNSKP